MGSITIRRRRLLAGLSLATGLSGLASRSLAVARRPMSIGMTLPLTGPFANYGQALKQGAAAAVVSDAGGGAGQAVNLKVLDDVGDPARAAANARELANDPSVLALVGGFGTESTAAMLPVLQANGLPLVGTTSGAESLRVQTNRYLFHLRAGYGDEAQAIVVQLDQLGMGELGVLHQDDAFGLEGVEGAKIEIARLAWRPAIASVRSDGSDLKQAVQQIANERPAAVLLIAHDRLAASAVQEFVTLGQKPMFMALAEAGTPELIQALGPLARGFGLSQVFPHPWSGSTQLARAYQSAMQKSSSAMLSYPSLEGYVYARTAIEGWRRAGGETSRDKLIAAFESGGIDLGGFALRFTPHERRGTRFTAMTVVGEKGRILR